VTYRQRCCLRAAAAAFSSASARRAAAGEPFRVHALGETRAEVTQGTASAWERARYEWDTQRGHLTVTTHDAEVFGPGGSWVCELTSCGQSEQAA